MLCNPTSYYPHKIDNMIFFQDNNLENVEIMNQYNELIAQGKYSEASDYINQQEGIYGFFADFFNLIENRIYTLQEYLLQKPPKKQPFIFYDEEEHFSISDLHVFKDVYEEEDFSINDTRIFTDIEEEEDLSSIKLFNNNENEESIEDIHVFESHYNWIEEDISSIYLFSDNDEQESIDDLYMFTGEEAEPPNVDKDTIWI